MRAGLASAQVDAAMRYARRGWPVFPCSDRNGRPLLARDKDAAGNPIANSGGVTKATCDEEQIAKWWRKWPHANIGVAVGQGGLLLIDFDPRDDEEVDEDTGEVSTRRWTVPDLKAALAAQMGADLPPTLVSHTPSGGEHHWFRMPAGEAIGNRGNLPRHIDVRGLGGYVIAPPSERVGDLDEGGKKGPGAYSWADGDDADRIAPLPVELERILRSAPSRGDRRATDLPDRDGGRTFMPDLDEAHRRYAMNALDAELRELASTPRGGGRHGGRNQGAYWAAFNLGQFVGAGALGETIVRQSLLEVVRGFDPAAYDSHAGAIENGIENGRAKPRDLSAVGARTRRGRPGGATVSDSAVDDGRPSVPSDAYAEDAEATRPAGPRPAQSPSNTEPSDDRSSQMGKVSHVSATEEGQRAQLVAAAGAWFGRRLDHVERARAAILRLAFSVGQRIAAGLLDEAETREALFSAFRGVGDILPADLEKAVGDGVDRGFDLAPALLAAKCAGYPLTDFGIAERFRDRFGHDYRFTTAKGWVGWDGRRWKVLDQDEKTPPAEVIAAVFETVRLIQEEATFIADTGVRWQLLTLKGPRGGDYEEVDEEDDSNPHGLDRWIAKGKSFVRLSDTVRAFGRASETTGKPASVATLARRWLTVPIEQFDVDPLAIGVLNGTLRFVRGVGDDGARWARVVLSGHRREDYNTKLAPIDYDPAATAPLYDAMLEWAQPDEAVRRYLHQVGGYGATGLTGEHKLWYNFGRGRNGKSTTIDAWCHSLGDYAATTLIETFLDQGIKKRGDQASPDLARLGGVRMLRASEPERGAKLNSALIKFVTGGEPVPTRALHRGFFELLPRFKLLISGNTKPEIPDTDEGIWSRMKLISWLKNIDLEFNDDGTPKKDPDLLDKIKASEAAGVFRRLVDGLLDYLRHGLIEPSTVTADTQAYRDASDPLARFLRECVVADDQSSVQSSILHGVFVAWAKAAGEREWTNKGFSAAMTEKGYRKHKSNGMHWLDLRLVRSADDFVDDDGNVRDLSDAAPPRAPPASAPTDAWDDDTPL